MSRRHSFSERLQIKPAAPVTSPIERCQGLLDAAIRFGEIARAGIAKRDFEALETGIARMQAIIVELIESLRPEHGLDQCQRLASLLRILHARLEQAGRERNAAIIDETIDLLGHERGTWDQSQANVREENTAAARLATIPNAAPPFDPALLPRPTGLIAAIVNGHG